MVALFIATSFLTASLLFLVQPMVGRMVLPAFGGSPQVWTTSMLFFQVALLTGYAYTHLATTRLPSRIQPWLHLAVALLPMAALPIALSVAPSGRGGSAPSLELLAGLTVGVAAPFILVATSGPLVQRWFSWTSHPRSQDPYFLYAAGNVGSAAGLIAYPFVLEPFLSIDDQSRLWAAGYGLAVLLIGGCAVVVRRSGPVPSLRKGAPEEYTGPEPPKRAKIPPRRLATWLLLAFVPSSLMLAVTTLLTTDIAAVPLLWVAPLGIYLLTFTLAFSSYGPAVLRLARYAAPISILGAVALRPPGAPVLVALGAQLLLVLVGGTLAHGLLAADRPEPHHLTRFYLVVAVGGAVGGLFNSLIAPALFPTALEYGTTILLLAALVVRWREPVAGASGWGPGRRITAGAGLMALPLLLFLLLATSVWQVPFGIRAAAALLLALPLVAPIRESGALGLAIVVVAFLPQVLPLATSELIERTFFGIHRITFDGDTKQLVHGTTVHGTQDFASPEARRRPISYYHPDQPFGEIFDLVADDARIGVLGLGAGGIAAHGQAGQTMVFHEIDPAVVEIARTSFTYLDETAANVEVVLGDGRLTLDGVEGGYDLLVMDAFTSDAVPVHLLTMEAVSSYLDTLAPDGVIAVNISNRYLDLRPVLAAITSELNISGLYTSGDGEPSGATQSRWVALARSPDRLLPLHDAGWSELPEEKVLWTDQRSALWQVVVR
jgi:hypothetical protein